MVVKKKKFSNFKCSVSVSFILKKTDICLFYRKGKNCLLYVYSKKLTIDISRFFRFDDRRIHRSDLDDPLYHLHFRGTQRKLVGVPHADVGQVPHHRCHGAGGRRARGTATCRHPRPRLLRQSNYIYLFSVHIL